MQDRVCQDRLTEGLPGSTGAMLRTKAAQPDRAGMIHTGEIVAVTHGGQLLRHDITGTIDYHKPGQNRP